VGDDGQRSAPPTPRKLKRAREQGDVVRSVLATGAASLLLAPLPLLAAPVFSHWFAAAWSRCASWAVDAVRTQTGNSGIAPPLFAPADALAPIALAALAAIAAAVASSCACGSFSFTPVALRPRFDRLSPSRGFRALAPAADNLFSTIFAFGAVALIAACAWPLARAQAAAVAVPPANIMLQLIPQLATALWFRATIILSAFAGMEILVARKRRLARLMMTAREVRDERNEHEGRPEVKARRRGIAVRRSRRLRLAAVRNATAVITNPTHVAVALRYAPPAIDVPVVVCSGADAAAALVRGAASEHGVPVVESPELARQLFLHVDVDDPIPDDLYEAVAAIFAFILRIRGALPGSV
jgi:flagellar biosynthesis protein FlhB